MTSALQTHRALAPRTAPGRRPSRPATRPPAGEPRRLDPHEAADHLTRLYRMALGLCGSRELAEDLVQETYARVLARPRLIRGDDFSYLARALRNVLINHARSEGRRRETPAPEDLDPPDPRPSADPEAAALTDELYGVIARLPRDQRRTVAAVDLGGMTYAEAAALTGVPVGTVMSRLYRARERIALALAL